MNPCQKSKGETVKTFNVKDCCEVTKITEINLRNRIHLFLVVKISSFRFGGVVSGGM